MADSKQIKDLISNLDLLDTKIKEIAASFLKLNQDATAGAKKTSEAVKNQTEVERKNKTAVSELEKLQKQRITTIEKLKVATSAEAREVALNNVKLQQARKANKELALEKLGLVSLYQKESKRLNELNKKYKEAALRYGENSKQARRLLKDLTKLDTKLKRIDESAGRFNRSVGNYAKGLRSLGSVLGAVGLTGGIFGLVQILRKGTEVLIDFDEGVANLRKTTNSTREEAVALAQEINTINTKTSVKELLALATAGGRLELRGRELVEFTREVDKAFVALGDTLEGSAEEIGLTLGKISSVLGVEEEFGVGEGINKIGSALNELGAKSKANEQFLIDFAKRVQGVAKVAKIAAPDVFALAALFDETGQSVEISATTINKLLPEIGKNTAKFAKIAGVSLQEFEKIAREDAFQALKLVAIGAKSSDEGLIALAKTLENYGIKAARATAIVSVLSEGTDRLTELQLISNTAFEEATSLSAEFAIKNETLGAGLTKTAKLWKQLIVAFQESDGTLAKTARLLNDIAELSRRSILGEEGRALEDTYSAAADKVLDFKKSLEGTNEDIIAQNELQIKSLTEYQNKLDETATDYSEIGKAIEDLTVQNEKLAAAEPFDKEDKIAATKAKLTELSGEYKNSKTVLDALNLSIENYAIQNTIGLEVSEDVRDKAHEQVQANSLLKNEIELLRIELDKLIKSDEEAVEVGEDVVDNKEKQTTAYQDLVKEISTLNKALLNNILLQKEGVDFDALDVREKERLKKAVDDYAKSLKELNKIDSSFVLGINSVDTQDAVESDIFGDDFFEDAIEKALGESNIDGTIKDSFPDELPESQESLRILFTELFEDIVNDETVQAFISSAELIADSIQSIADVQISAIDKTIDAREANIADLQSKIKEAEQLQERGASNNLSALERSLERENEARDSALAKRDRINNIAVLAQIAVDTASAISSLTAASSANPTNAVTFGAAGAIQFAAGLIQIFASIAQAKQALSTTTFEDGGTWVEGGKRHSDGGNKYGNKEVEKGERMSVFSRAATSKFDKEIVDFTHAINSNDLDSLKWSFGNNDIANSYMILGAGNEGVENRLDEQLSEIQQTNKILNRAKYMSPDGKVIIDAHGNIVRYE
ncbi:MAG: phage tail tape measure protein [Aureibaculum sp.]|nr:phage tail tape measure protein [Aureibaculum sp.]